MNNYWTGMAIKLNLVLLTLLTGQIPAKAQINLPLTIDINGEVKTKEPPKKPQETEPSKCERVAKTSRLYFIREATRIKVILDAIKNNNPKFPTLRIAENGEIGIILYGCKGEVSSMSRVIATLDLPRPGINMEMWGIQISSSNPEKLAKVIQEVNQEIAKTQKLMQDTYKELERLAIAVPVESKFESLLENELGYTSLFDPF